LTEQKFKNFETIVVESGSSIKSDKVVESFSNLIDVHYVLEGNNGQGFSRNAGMKKAKGDFFVILDSDILLPDFYLENINNHLQNHYLDAFGGPDKLHPASSTFQKAVNFCMTSFLTTGGTRGKKSKVGQYYPRSFNMGVSREVFETVGGFNIPFMGEDIEWSHRIIKNGFKTGLIENAYVFHERKKTLKTFFQQINFFGKARINISQLVKNSFKWLHLLPLAYCGYVFIIILSFLFSSELGSWLAIPFFIYNLLILIFSSLNSKNGLTGLFSVICTNALMLGYCKGMITEFFNLYIFKNKQSYQL